MNTQQIEERNEKMAREKWEKMVNAARDAVEDFNDFIEDKAILWADKQLKEKSEALSCSARSDCSVNGLKDHQIAELTNFVKQRICERGHKRVVISEAITGFLESNNLRLDSQNS